MKKLFFGLVATIMFGLSGNAQKLNVTIVKCNEELVKSVKDWYKGNHSDVVLGFSEQAYSVKVDNNKYGFNSIEVFEKNKFSKELTIKSYLIDATSTNGSYEEHIIYLYREVLIGEKRIVEIVDAITNDIIDVDLVNISEEEYQDYNNTYSTGKRPICFKSFGSCFKRLTTWDPLSQAACDFFPCNSIAYTCCVIASGEGYIQNEEGFIGVKNCSAVYKTSGKSYIKL